MTTSTSELRDKYDTDTLPRPRACTRAAAFFRGLCHRTRALNRRQRNIVAYCCCDQLQYTGHWRRDDRRLHAEHEVGVQRVHHIRPEMICVNTQFRSVYAAMSMSKEGGKCRTRALLYGATTPVTTCGEVQTVKAELALPPVIDGRTFQKKLLVLSQRSHSEEHTLAQMV